MPKWKSRLWSLIRRESEPEKVDGYAVLTLILYLTLAAILLVPMAIGCTGTGGFR